VQTRPWLASYPLGVPHEISIEPGLTLSDLLDRAIARFAERPAFSCRGATLTFAELETFAAAFAAFLQSRGLAPGDRFAIMQPNGLAYPIALLGALRAGLVVVNVNPLYTPRELSHQLSDSGARAILVLEDLLPTLDKVTRQTSIELTLHSPTSDLQGYWRSLAQAEPRSHADISGSLDFASALAVGLRSPFRAPEIDESAPAFLQYTGGTTGISKGAVLTHANMVAGTIQESTWFAPALPEGEASIITPLPLYHIYPLAVLLYGIVRGCHNRLVPDPRNLPQLIATMGEAPFEMFLGINTLLVSLLSDPELTKVDFSRTRCVTAAGAAVQIAVADRWQAVTGVPLSEAYGLTEASPGVALNPCGADRWTQRVGIPLPSTDIRLVDENGLDLEVEQAGELWVRGPQVFAGYWRRPEETREVLTEDGWLRTGDIAVMDELGYLRIVDRKKDMILVSGFNVYPNEIEDVVAQLPGVRECACVGVPDGKTGEAARLLVVASEPLSVEAVREHCRRNLTAYKVPRHISFVESLPKSSVGKILRRELRDAPV